MRKLWENYLSWQVGAGFLRVDFKDNKCANIAESGFNQAGDIITNGRPVEKE